MIAGFRRRVELTVKLLQQSRARGNTIPQMTGTDAAKALIAFQMVVAIADLVGVTSDIIVEEIQDILKQHPELWPSVDETVEVKLTA